MASKFTVTKLKGSENYQGWAIMAQAFLAKEGFAKAVENKAYDIDGAQRKAKATITLLCEYSTANHIINYKTAFKAWKLLKNLYNSNSFTSKYILLQRFFSTSQANFESLKAYISNLKAILNNLASQDLQINYIVSIA